MAPPKDTRERLVEAARDLFLSQGYHATGVAQILRAAGARSGSLYYFFPTKEDLLLAVLDWYQQNLHPEVIEPVFARVSDPVERVFGILDGYRRMMLCTECRQGCPIGNLALELADSHPQVRELLARNFTQWRDAIQACLDAAAGRLPEETDTETLATFVLTTMEGAVMLARTYRSLAPFDAAVSQLREYFERLVTDGSNWNLPRRRVQKSAQPRRPQRR